MSRSGKGAFYFMLTVAVTVFSVWFAGPRLIEEYHYAAAIGQARAEYDNAAGQLRDQSLTEVSMAYQLVAQRIRPSVVSVNAMKSREDGSGLGSGVIMSENGYIVTNAHVVQDARRIRVQLFNKRPYTATLVGMDETSDLAVLKIDAEGLIPAQWGDSDSLEVGSIVWAIGSPYGFEQTITSGILSGKDRPGDPRHRKQSLLQTDAAVNPGNSGGPLVDVEGRVIGINTSIFGETFQGISFAVPSSTAQFVYEQLVSNGRVVRAFLGVQPGEVHYRVAQRNQMDDLDGAQLDMVEPNSPAAMAGMRRGDIIRSWNGTPIGSHLQLYRLSASTPPYTEVELTLLRDGRERRTKVRLGKFPTSF